VPKESSTLLLLEIYVNYILMVEFFFGPDVDNIFFRLETYLPKSQ
jgi:hypothetical protein